jgi:ABC-type Fe3+-siderophore transport system permease subunit
MNLLLPHRFKRTGIVMAVSGFAFWLLMQKGAITQFLTFLLGVGELQNGVPPYHFVNVGVATISFFCFLGGVYCTAFSKEKIEDEMVQKIRVDSFQMAALMQLLLTICGFLLWIVTGNGNEGESIILVLTASLLAFWFFFIARFHYVLHAKMR